MKSATLVTADIYTGKPLSTSEAFYKPILELIQRFYEERGDFIPEDIEKSPMMICGAFTYDSKQWGAKDTIIVSRGPIFALLHPGMKANEFTNLKNGAHVFNDAYKGSTIIRIVSKDNSQRIGDEVFDLICLLRNEVKKAGIFQMENLVCQPEAKVEGGANPDLMMVQISLDSTMQRRWTVTKDAPLVAGVNSNVIY